MTFRSLYSKILFHKILGLLKLTQGIIILDAENIHARPIKSAVNMYATEKREIICALVEQKGKPLSAKNISLYMASQRSAERKKGLPWLLFLVTSPSTWQALSLQNQVSLLLTKYNVRAQ